MVISLLHAILLHCTSKDVFLLQYQHHLCNKRQAFSTKYVVRSSCPCVFPSRLIFLFYWGIWWLGYDPCDHLWPEINLWPVVTRCDQVWPVSLWGSEATDRLAASGASQAGRTVLRGAIAQRSAVQLLVEKNRQRTIIHRDVSFHYAEHLKIDGSHPNNSQGSSIAVRNDKRDFLSDFLNIVWWGNWFHTRGGEMV